MATVCELVSDVLTYVQTLKHTAIDGCGVCYVGACGVDQCDRQCGGCGCWNELSLSCDIYDCRFYKGELRFMYWYHIGAVAVVRTHGVRDPCMVSAHSGDDIMSASYRV